MKVARSAYVTLKSLIFAKQKATLKIKIQNSTFVPLYKIRKPLNYRFIEIKHLDSTYYLYLFYTYLSEKMEAKLTLK